MFFIILRFVRRVVNNEVLKVYFILKSYSNYNF